MLRLLHVLGLLDDVATLSWAQVAARSAVVYGVGLVLLRVGKKRAFNLHSAFDVVFALLFGSVLSRAVNGTAPLGSTFVASAALTAVHWLLSALAAMHHGVGSLVKGHEVVLLRDGRLLHDALRASHVSERDLREEVRLRTCRDDLAAVRVATLERSGGISAVLARTPRVVEVAVEPGVQVVRVELV